MISIMTQRTNKNTSKEENSKIIDLISLSDLKGIDFEAKFNQKEKSIQSICEDLKKDANFDKIRQNLDFLLGVFEEKDEANMAQRYNLLLYFMIFSQSKEVYSYKLLESKFEL